MVFINVINFCLVVNWRNEYVRIIVCCGVFIGVNVIIVCGNDIGVFFFIGVGVVVIKEVLVYVFMVGNLVCQIGWMSEYGYWLIFDSYGNVICLESWENYWFENNWVEKIEL